MGLFGNLYLFTDAVVLQSLTEVDGQPIGEYTLLEIRRSCLTTVFILMCASLKDLANDPEHKRM
jgi:hypothetical protein